jgi:hypothetical protein
MEAATTTRRTFIRGIAAAGASSTAALGLDATGALDLFSDEAAAASPNDFSSFRAIAPSAADAFQVPAGYSADVLIEWGDAFANEDGTAYTYGFNNDFLAYFPLRGSDEGLLFVNHEYPNPYFQHGQTDPNAKTAEQVAIEQESVGNAVVHVKRNGDGVFEVVSPSPYNRRVTGASPALRMTGPLAGDPAFPGVGTTAKGSVANCSGGITPWNTALSCEENYQDYDGTYGWQRFDGDYRNGDGTAADKPAKYGWVCEHDPYDASATPRKHTALGRFRHENTAFRADAGRKFVLYMGDDRTDGGVYKFVSDLPFRPGRREENLRVLEAGTLYVARWSPEGRRRYDTGGNLLTTTSGDGTWRPVSKEELVDCHARIRAAVGTTEWNAHYATNRPEDLEVAEDGTVFIALTNNSTVNDVHGSIRTLREAGNDPTATAFTWEDYAAGGPSGREDAGEGGFSSPDNLVFDKAGNLWVVTDVSSSALNKRDNVKFHANNAVFLVPRTGPNAGVAFRFANMPVEAEGTGPYFTPDERTLFVNVQHPGEESGGDPADPANYTSHWPEGGSAKPRPATVMVTKLTPRQVAGGGGAPTGSNTIPATAADTALPLLYLLSAERQSLRKLLRSGLSFRIRVDEPVALRATLVGRLTSKRGRGRGKERRLAQTTVRTQRAGEVVLRLKPSAAIRLLLRREARLPAALLVRAEDAAGNVRTRRKRLTFR